MRFTEESIDFFWKKRLELYPKEAAAEAKEREEQRKTRVAVSIGTRPEDSRLYRREVNGRPGC